MWALTVLAMGAAAGAASAAERSDAVLVRVDADAPAAERAAIGRALDAEASRGLMAGWRVYELPQEVSLGQVTRLLADADAAERVQLDHRLSPLSVPDDPSYGSQWALPAIGAPSGWAQAAGAAPVTVAVIDTGVDVSHPDLAGRIRSNPGEVPANGIDDDANGYVDDVTGWNFFDHDNQVYSAADGDSHGTHVAGTIAAVRGNATGVAGVADNARILPLKFLKPDGGYTSDAITAIDYAVDAGAEIINASWGGAGYSSALCDAIAQAGAAGVLFVAAAGNDGTSNDTTAMWPANCPASNLVSVAATTSTGALASFSNRGPTQVDLGAPGQSVLSTTPAGAYGYKSGTSMAAPHVAGVAAIVRGVHPGLSVAHLRAALLDGGHPLGSLTGLTASGREVDLPGALAVAAGSPPPVPAPPPTLPPAAVPITDLTPPAPFAALGPVDGAVSSSARPVLRWSASSDASGIARYRVVIDRTVVAEVGPATTQHALLHELPDGHHTWNVVAVDPFGNLRSTGVRTLTIDATAPTRARPRSPGARTRVRGRVVRLSWTASADGLTGLARYRLVVDRRTVATLGPSRRTARVRLRPGVHTWRVVAIDLAGNSAAGPGRRVVIVRPR